MSTRSLPENAEPERRLHQPIFGTFGDYPAPPDGWARCTICLGLITAKRLEDVCPGPPSEDPAGPESQR